MRASPIVLALLVSSAAAKPLPKGVKVTFEKDQLLFTENGVTVPVYVDSAKSYSDFKGAELSDDGADVVIHIGSCVGEDEPRTVGLTELEARVENTLGMQLHLKKKYGDAIPHFTLAVTKDPGTAMYATNLLSAQAMAGKLDDADKILASEGPRSVPWFAWRLAVDPELKALRGRPSMKPFAAAKPSKLGWPVADKKLAVSPMGYVAIGDDLLLGMGPNVNVLAIYDIKANHRVFKMNVTTGCMREGPMADPAGVCTKKQPAEEAAHTADASAILAVLGFAAEPIAWRDRNEIVDSDKVTSPDKTVQIAFTPDKVTITRGKATKTVNAQIVDRVRVGFTKNLVVVQSRAMYGCGGADSQQLTSDVFELP